MTDSKYSRLLKNIILIFCGNISVKAVQLLMIPFYTRYFPPAEYGVLDLIAVYTTMLIALCVCNIYDSVFIFPHGKTFAVQKAYFSTGLLFGLASLLVTGGVFLCLRWIFHGIGYQGIFAEYLGIIWLTLFASFLQNYIQQFARGSDKMLVYVLMGLVYAVCLALLGLILIPRYAMNGYLAAMVFSPLVAAIFGFFLGRMSKFFSIFSVDKRFLYEMLRFSIPLIPATFLWWLVNSSNRPILENCFGLAAVGIFAIAAKLPGIMNMMYAVFGNAWQISAVEEFRKPDYEIYYNQMFLCLFSLLALVSCTVSVFAKILVRLIAAPEFFPAWQYIPLLTLAVVFSSSAGFVGVNFTARKEGKYFFYSSLICAAANILLNFCLIPVFSMWGAALSVCLSCFILFLLRVFYAWKYVKLRCVKKLFLLAGINVFFLFLVKYCADFRITLSALCLAGIAIFILNYKIFLSFLQKIRTMVHP